MDVPLSLGDMLPAYLRNQMTANLPEPYQLGGRPLRDWIPANWFAEPDLSSVRMRAYFVAGSKLQAPAVVPLAAGKVLALVYSGPLKWFELTSSRSGPTNVNMTICEKELGENTYLLLLVPFAIDGRPGNEASSLRLLNAAAGLLAATTSPNIIHARIFEMTLGLGAESKITINSDPLRNPAWFDPPVANDHPFELFTRAVERLETAGVGDRIHRSLRWYEGALREYDGADALIKHWVAIESLAMPDTTNVRPLVDSLANAYGWSPEEVRQRFMVGRLQGLRSTVIHDGARHPLDSNVLSFMAALYEDLLLAELREPCERKAVRFLESRPSFDLAASIRAAEEGTQPDDAQAMGPPTVVPPPTAAE